MKQCVRCGQKVNDDQQFCVKCGGTNFRTIVQQNRPQQPMQNRMNNNGFNQQNMQMQQQQRVMPGQPKPNRPGQQNMQNMQNMQQIQNQNQLNNVQQPKKLKKVSKKEQQAREMKMLYAMREAQQRGEAFDEEAYKQQNGWYETVGTSNNNMISQGNTAEMSVLDWIKTFLLMLIPIVNLVIAFSGMKNMSNPEYKRNYYKAFLIYYIAVFAISIAVANLM